MDLSPRQLEVVALVARGKQDKEIADILGIGLGTAKSHVQSSMDRLGIHSRVDLAVWYVCKRVGDTCVRRKHRTPFDLRSQLLPS
jgi:DNA-binding CsgD family transcriptional regulator